MNTSLSGLQRQHLINDVSGRSFDLLIIGGGITGAGIALDAAARGMSVLLVEMQDFAQGTSSRSTKLVHGGLRYLKQFDIKVVAEVGKERAIVYDNGPHVTTPEWMLLPIYKGGTFGKWSTSLGLMVYDRLAGVHVKERRKMLNRQQTLEKASILKKEGLQGGGYYVEYRTDDARLTIEVLKKAVQLGATALNYSKVDSFIYKKSKVSGVQITDQISGQPYSVYGNKIINATGPWVDHLREADGSKQGKYLLLTKGIHLVFDNQKIPLKQAVYFDTPDGRMVFAIPREGKTYVGTTDTHYKGDLCNPRMTEGDRKYIFDAINDMFPDLKVMIDDVESSWVGLRPLIHEEGKKPSEISRKDEIWFSDSGLITIAGGKLTGYRKMAELVVDKVAGMFQEEGLPALPKCKTKHIPISGGDVGGAENFPAFVLEKVVEGLQYGFSEEQAEKLVRRYGSNINKLYQLAQRYKSVTISSGLPLDLIATLQYSIQEEMTVRPVDYFIRRTGSLLFNRAWVEWYKKPVVEYMAAVYGMDDETKKREEADINKYLEEAVEALKNARGSNYGSHA